MKKWVLALLLLALPVGGQTITNIFNAGETLDFELSWLGITGGGMRMTVGVAPNDPLHYRLTSVARTNPSFSLLVNTRDEVASLVNRDDFSTIRYEKHLKEKGKAKDDVTTVDETRRVATRQRPNKTPQVMSVPKPVFDPLSLVYHLRALNLQPGTVQRFTVYADGKVYTLEANVSHTETIGTPAGTFHTIVVEPKMLAGGLFKDEGSMTIWFSDDVRHIPVRIRSELKVGSISANLRGVHMGVSSPEPILGR